MIEEQRKRRFILPNYNNDMGKSTIKYVGSKIFNEKAPLLNLENWIKTFSEHVKKMYMTYPEE